MSTLQVRLFGEVSIQRSTRQPDRAEPGLSAKALELLCYLLLYRDRPHTREVLSEVLWPEATLLLSKKYLRQTLWQLRTALEDQDGPGRPEADALLILSPGWVRLNPRAPLWLDVAAFEQAYGECRDLPGPELRDSQARALEEAVLLYRGDLIEAWYQDWCIYERDRLQLTFLAMLEKLTAYCEARRRYEKGVAYGQRILRHDPAREYTHRQLMRLYQRAGDRTTALRQFERCTAAMARQFQLRPSQETVALYEQIRADRLDGAGADGTATPHPATGPGTELAAAGQPLDQVQSSLAALRDQVDQMQTTLSVLQDELKQQLTAMRGLLRGGMKTARQTPTETG